MRKVPVDKQAGLWFNDIRTYIKDIDGKFASVLTLQRAGGWCEPVRRT